MLHPLPVAAKRFAPIAPVHGPVEFRVRPRQRRGHGQRRVGKGVGAMGWEEGRAGKVRAIVRVFATLGGAVVEYSKYPNARRLCAKMLCGLTRLPTLKRFGSVHKIGIYRGFDPKRTLDLRGIAPPRCHLVSCRAQ